MIKYMGAIIVQSDYKLKYKKGNNLWKKEQQNGKNTYYGLF